MEMKGFKYQITLCVLLSKVKSSSFIDYLTIYLNRLSLEKNII